MNSFFTAVAFPYVVGVEGGLSMDPNDAGNWTGGAVGRGELKGSKYGVSAAAFPHLDIANLSLADAQQIAWDRYWVPAGCDKMGQGIALCVFDFAYNHGVHGCLEVLATVPDDRDQQLLINNFTTARVASYQQMSGYDRYGAGWEARAYLTEQRAIKWISTSSTTS